MSTTVEPRPDDTVIADRPRPGAPRPYEFPTVAYAADYDDWGYDGMFVENMVVCVESYIGAVGGTQGVKLEQQVLITASGAVSMSSDPMIDALKP